MGCREARPPNLFFFFFAFFSRFSIFPIRRGFQYERRSYCTISETTCFCPLFLFYLDYSTPPPPFSLLLRILTLYNFWCVWFSFSRSVPSASVSPPPPPLPLGYHMWTWALKKKKTKCIKINKYMPAGGSIFFSPLTTTA